MNRLHRTIALVAAAMFASTPVVAADILSEWSTVKAPAAPQPKPVKLDPTTTALLMLDFTKQGCNMQRRPRCVATIPAVQKALAAAREHRMPVVFTLGRGATAADIAPELAPRPGERVLVGTPDKFLNTELENILKDGDIQTVVLVGTASHGAVLQTGTSAAFRGFKVIIPADGVSAESLYAEQYGIWHMLNAPGVGSETTLTRLDLMSY